VGLLLLTGVVLNFSKSKRIPISPCKRKCLLEKLRLNASFGKGQNMSKQKFTTVWILLNPADFVLVLGYKAAFSVECQRTFRELQGVTPQKLEFQYCYNVKSVTT
jgi:hypothetical protein